MPAESNPEDVPPAPDDPLYRRETRAAARRRPGLELGRFRLQRLLGRGGMGEVWEAFDPARGGPVVLKFLPDALRGFPDEVERIRSSFRKVQALNHQHIAPLYDLIDDPRFGPFLVMMFIDGQTLAQRREPSGGAWPAAEAAAVLRPVAEALDHAHAKGVIHRDVKPENVMLDGSGHTYLIDFGLAETVQRSLSRVSGAVPDASGTYPFMAPEQWRGRPQDGRADQYALAVVAYELMAGHLPFDHRDPKVLRECVLNDPVPPLRLQNAAVNAALTRGLAKDPDDRFPTCATLVEELAQAAKEPASPAAGPAAVRELAPSAPHHPSRATAGRVGTSGRRWVTAGAVAVVVLGLGYPYRGMLWPGPAAQPSPPTGPSPVPSRPALPALPPPPSAPVTSPPVTATATPPPAAPPPAPSPLAADSRDAERRKQRDAATTARAEAGRDRDAAVAAQAATLARELHDQAATDYQKGDALLEDDKAVEAAGAFASAQAKYARAESAAKPLLAARTAEDRFKAARGDLTEATLQAKGGEPWKTLDREIRDARDANDPARLAAAWDRAARWLEANTAWRDQILVEQMSQTGGLDAALDRLATGLAAAPSEQKAQFNSLARRSPGWWARKAVEEANVARVEHVPPETLAVIWAEVGLALARAGDTKAKEDAWENARTSIRNVSRQHGYSATKATLEARFHCYFTLADAQLRAGDRADFADAIESAKSCLSGIDRDWGYRLGVADRHIYWVNARLKGYSKVAGLYWRGGFLAEARASLTNALAETHIGKMKPNGGFDENEGYRPCLTRYALVLTALAAEKPETALSWMTLAGRASPFDTMLTNDSTQGPEDYGEGKNLQRYLLWGHRVSACCLMLRQGVVQDDADLFRKYRNLVDGELARFEFGSTFDFLTDLGAAEAALGKTGSALQQLESLQAIPLGRWITAESKKYTEAQIHGEIALHHARSGGVVKAYDALAKAGSSEWIPPLYVKLGRLVGTSDKADLADALVWIVGVQQGNHALGAAALAGVSHGLAETSKP